MDDLEQQSKAAREEFNLMRGKGRSPSQTAAVYGRLRVATDECLPLLNKLMDQKYPPTGKSRNRQKTCGPPKPPPKV